MTGINRRSYRGNLKNEDVIDWALFCDKTPKWALANMLRDYAQISTESGPDFGNSSRAWIDELIERKAILKSAGLI